MPVVHLNRTKNPCVITVPQNLELLALKWSVCEKFRDYLIGSKFTVLTDNNPLTYVRTSRLGMHLKFDGFPISRYSTLTLSTERENLIRQLMLLVGDL